MKLSKSFALLAFLGMFAVGLFAQSTQSSSAYYASERLCWQLDRACAQYTATSPFARMTQRACAMRDQLCGVSGQGVSSSSESSTMACADTVQLLCIQGTHQACVNGEWQCAPDGSSSSSANSCGPNTVLCAPGTMPVCSNGEWGCVSQGSSSSSSTNACLAYCPDGHEYRTCGEDGSPIYYFADPCLNHYGSSGSLARQSSSAMSDVGSDSSSCYCTLQYDPVCGSNGQTYGNACQARCAKVSVAHDGACWMSSSSSSKMSVGTQPDICGVVCTQSWPPTCRDTCTGSSVPSGLGLNSSSSSSSLAATGGCKVAGCSSQICVDENDSGVSTCEWREEYACYQTATCARQANGQCGWTQTQELQSCLNNN